MAQGSRGPPAATAAPLNGVSHPPAPGGVNRKKQKRREKLAAKQAAEMQKHNPLPAKNGHPPPGQSSAAPLHPPSRHPAPQYADPELDDPSHYDDDVDFYSDEEGEQYEQAYPTNGHYPSGYTASSVPAPAGKKAKKKKRGTSAAQQQQQTPYHAPLAPRHLPSHHPPPPRTSKSTSNNDRIWDTSTTEERERIREFWLSLGEDERKALVKIEKEAVLRKMKEQQKHSCSCTVCGRKRTAIEEELEVLYDAYYEELEQYANHQQDVGPILPPLQLAHAHRSVPPHHRLMHTHPPLDQYDDPDDLSQGDEDEDQDYSNSEISSDEDYSSEDRASLPPPPEADFLSFGNSLQVKGGILTVADDLLKNDGKKFIEMMEQLAERRMQREEEAQFNSHPSMYPRHSHSHGPPPEEDDYDDEDDYEEGDEDGDYEEDEEDEDDTMTEEQRMEEGRRMFQIFAARMFEQRVLQAYREKVAAERQQKLLEELAEEEHEVVQLQAKKAKDAAKKKEKKERQRLAKAEEKARKDAEQAAKEAEAKAAEDKRQEEQRKKKEELKKKRDAERKAQEEEKQRKEADRLKRQQEERDRQQETERKQRELKAQEKKAKEEARRKEREEREAREKEAREKKAHEDKDRRERDAKAKAEKDRLRKEEQAATAEPHPGSTRKKSSQPIPVALPPGLLKQTSSTGMPSPHVTPAVPKAPTPNRPRQSSQQGSHGSSPKTPYIAPGTSKSMSPSSQVQNPIVPKSILTKPQTSQAPASIPHAQPTSPMLPLGPPPGMQGPPGMGIGNLPPGLNGFPRGQGPMVPPGMGGPHHNMGHNMPGFPPGPQNYRGFPPPGMHAPNPMSMGRGFPLDGPPGFGGMPAFGGPNQIPGFGMGMPSHSRQASGSFDKPNVESPIAAPSAQPIQRPAPIQRPSSVKPHEPGNPQGSDVDELADHLGSKALLDDADDVSEFPPEMPRRTSLQTHGSLRGNPLAFGFSDAPGQPRTDTYAPFGGSSNAGSVWSTPPIGFPMTGATGWGNSPTSGVFGGSFPPMMGAPRTNEPRLVWLRKLLCAFCKTMAPRQASSDGFLDANEVHAQIEGIRSQSENPVVSKEIKEACDIFGDPTNGGGNFEYKEVAPGRLSHIKFVESSGPTSALGEIGSPVPGHSVPAGGFGARPFPGLGPQGF